MKKSMILMVCLVLALFQGHSQKNLYWNSHETKTLMLEKIGTRHRYGFELGDMIKLKTKKGDLYNTYLWELSDSSLALGQNKPIRIADITRVYPQFYFPKKFGKYMFLAGMVYFGVVSLNHLINNEMVFTKDVFIVPTACFGAGFICISLSQKTCRIGDRWKLKVVGIRIR